MAKRPPARKRTSTPEVERLMNQLHRADQKVVDAEALAQRAKNDAEGHRSRANYLQEQLDRSNEKNRDQTHELNRLRREVEDFKRDMKEKEERLIALEAKHRLLGKAFVASTGALAT